MRLCQTHLRISSLKIPENENPPHALDPGTHLLRSYYKKIVYICNSFIHIVYFKLYLIKSNPVVGNTTTLKKNIVVNDPCINSSTVNPEIQSFIDKDFTFDEFIGEVHFNR